MSNIRKVAKLSGVSISTVSRYINKTANVKESTKIKIEKVIYDLNYVPNALARSIFSKTTFQIGLIIPTLSNPFFSEISFAIENFASIKGYSVILNIVNDDKEKEKKIIKTLIESRVDGIIVARTKHKELYENLDIPIVALENKINDKIPLLYADNWNGGRLALEHLVTCGCEKILMFVGDNKHLPIRLRKNGFMDLARESNISIATRQLFDEDENKSITELKFLFSDAELYDGIFVYNDIMAVNLIRYLSAKNLFNEIGKKINIIGFDNAIISRHMNPTITTISQNFDVLGKKSISLLINLINGECVQPISIIKTTLIKRETTKN